MDILEKIAAHKRKELKLKKQWVSQTQLQQYALFERDTLSLRKSLEAKEYGIIAEHKRRSPSRPNINLSLDLIEVCKAYQHFGAGGISVLTDNRFFGGSLEDLLLARAATESPLLRKEFIIEEYQVIEAKAHGADAILLIAALLDKTTASNLAALAKSLNLEVLMEVHNEAELQVGLIPNVDLLGVNNRNLKTFEVSLETSLELVNKIPEEFLRVSESGLKTAADLKLLKSAGYGGFLMGETFMKTQQPGQTLSDLLKTVQDET